MNLRRRPLSILRNTLLVSACLFLTSCGGGGGGSSSSAGADPTPRACTGSCADTSTLLTVADVQGVIARAVNEARGRNLNATIAVVDRVGNVLGIWQMARQRVHIATAVNGQGVATINAGLEGINLDVNGVDAAAAVAKACLLYTSDAADE